jgi:anti-sigma B factor antagonist
MTSPFDPSPAAATAPDRQTVVHFAGGRISLDEAMVHTIRDQLFALADGPTRSDVVLEFGNVAYISSLALGTLVKLHKKLAADGRQLALRNLRPQIHEIFEVTRLNTILDLRSVDQGEEASDRPRAGLPATVLVVDDDPAVRDLLDIALRRSGFNVRTASGGQQAIDLYRRHLPEMAAVMLDVLMPGLDGPGTLAALQKICPAVCCCFMTGNPAPYSEEALLQMGAVRVLRKPFPVAEVTDMLHRLRAGACRGQQYRWLEIPLDGAP